MAKATYVYIELWCRVPGPDSLPTPWKFHHSVGTPYYAALGPDYRILGSDFSRLIRSAHYTSHAPPRTPRVLDNAAPHETIPLVGRFEVGDAL